MNKLPYPNMAHTGRVYNSISAALSALDSHREHCHKTGAEYSGNMSYNRHDTAFTGGTGYQGALDLLSNGWPAGAAKIATAARVDGLNAATETEYLPTFFPDVAGAYGFAAAALAGDPECFYRYDVQPQDKPVLRLAVNSGLQGRVDANDVINRAAAYLFLINTIEQSGTRVELWLVAGNRSEHKPSKNQRFNAIFNAVRVKEADQSTDLNRLAFLTGHAAMHRRLVFGLIEKAAIEWRQEKGGKPFGVDYGFSIDIDYHDVGKQLVDHYLGSDVYLLPAFSEPDTITASIESLTKRCIMALANDGILTMEAARDLSSYVDKAA